MELPKYHETFIPILEVLSNEGPLHYKQLGIRVLDEYYGSLPKDLLDEKIASTGGNKLLDRIYWGRSYLKMGKFVEYPSRGTVQITDKGRNILATGNFTLENLKKDPDYVTHCRSVQNLSKKESESEYENVESYTPQDLVDKGIGEIKNQVKADLLEAIKKIDPYEFQQIILTLLKKMGYGDTVPTPKSRDRGVDGVIREDKLGFGEIYIQTKCWNDTKVREKDIRDFIGAMSSDTAKGVFVTTSSFGNQAIEKAKGDKNHTIILIDGEQLVDFMYDYGIGVRPSKTYEIREVDTSFFEGS